jgi:two-component flavin-dependent monooxygenase
MRATASNSVLLDDVLVPASRSFPARNLVEGRPEQGTDARALVPLRAVNGLAFAAPILGAARGAETACWDEMGDALTGGADPVRSDREQLVGRGGGEIDAAELLLDRVARVADAGEVTVGQTLRAARDCALASDLLVSAVDRFARSAGTRGQLDRSPLQRFWRDVRAAGTHTMLRFPAAASAFVQYKAAARVGPA